MEHLVQDIERAPNGSILVLHTCCHNPTGIDPSMEQWAQLEKLIARKQHTVLFDTAYQGYGSGDLLEDAKALRYFVSKGHQVLVCQSFAKNMGLYAERIGSASVLCANAEQADAVVSRFEKVIRPMYSNPPKHCALIVSTVLGSPELREQWKVEMKQMADRIAKMRKLLHGHLKALGTPGTWGHVESQIGMFSYTGLTAPQVAHLTRVHHVYLLPSGRISMAGVNSGNVERLAAAIDDAVRSASGTGKL
jgi:aspartate aminotransferase